MPAARSSTPASAAAGPRDGTISPAPARSIPVAPANLSVTVERVRIHGAPAGIAPARLRAALERGLAQTLGASLGARRAPQAIDMPALELRLPPGATEHEIAAAVARAIAAQLSGGSES